MWRPVILKAILSSISIAVAGFVVRYGNSQTTKLWIYALATVGLFLGYAYLEYTNFVRPAFHVSKIRGGVLKVLAGPLLTSVRQIEPTARMNLMATSRPLRWLGLRQFFKILWFDGMENHPDVNVKIPIRHGVVGQCFKAGRPVIAGPQQIAEHLGRMGRRLRESLQDPTTVLAYPVYEPPRSSGRQSGKRVGVLNLDASSAGSFEKLTAQNVFDSINTKMQELARIAGLLIVR
jgi:hypothetical protein